MDEKRDWVFEWGDDSSMNTLRLHDKTETEAKAEAAYFGWTPKKWWQFWRNERHFYYQSSTTVTVQTVSVRQDRFLLH